MEQYCLYLRKSRADSEQEEHGEEETLARHEKTLLDLAKKLKLNVTQIYREVVSGETVAARPVMQQLLQEVEQGLWNGVLVMEVERLARGDTIDQGIVAQTFKYSDTKIITPLKTYNPDDEFDEEYFEFGLFMSRREYKTINRRLQRGRVASVKEGKFVGNIAPYGYKKVPVKNDKGFTLAIVEEEAQIVKLIFELYTVGEQQPDNTYKRLGQWLICTRLNDMSIPTRTGGTWIVSTVRDILMNPVYAGKIRWNWRQTVKKMVDGRISVSRPRSKDVIVCKGLHPPIISDETFNLAREIMSTKPIRPVGDKNTVKSPLAGIVTCGKCGRKMVRRPYSNGYPDTLMCYDPMCDNISSSLSAVENRILEALREWLEGYKLQWEETGKSEEKRVSKADIKRKVLYKLKNELETLYKQLSKTHDLLEQGIYDTDTFLERTRELSERISQTKTDITALEKDLSIEMAREESVINIIPKVENLLDIYDTLPTPKAKNDMLKEVLEKVVYTKIQRSGKKGDPYNFDLLIQPKIPMIEK